MDPHSCHTNETRKFHRRTGAQPAEAGFTLAELMVAATLSVFLLAGVLSSVVFFTKTALSMENYYTMSNHERKLTQYISRDIQDAEAATWRSRSQLDLTMKDTVVSYNYDQSSGILERSTLGGESLKMAENIKSLNFYAYDINGNEILENASDLSLASDKTKMIHLAATLKMKASETETTETVISSRYMLRNKSVSAP